MAAVVEAAEERPSLVEQLEKQCVIEPPNYADPTQPDVIWGRSVKEVVTIHPDAEDADSPEPDYVEKKAALKAVKKDGQALQWAHQSMKRSQAFMLEAAKNNVNMIKYASATPVTARTFCRPPSRDGRVFFLVPVNYPMCKSCLFEAQGALLANGRVDVRNWVV